MTKGIQFLSTPIGSGRVSGIPEKRSVSIRHSAQRFVLALILTILLAAWCEQDGLQPLILAATGDSEEIAGFDPLPSDNSGRIRLLRIVDTEPEGIAAMVGPRSKVRTDDSSGYSKLPRFGYEHVAVQQPPLGPKKVLPLGNRVASLLKRWLPRTHQGTIAHTHSGLLLGSFQVVFQPANLLDHADCCSTDQFANYSIGATTIKNPSTPDEEN